MQPLKFYLITDTHFYENSLGVGGPAYDEYIKQEQMCLRENSAVLDATFAEIARERFADILIIPGDLSKNGQKECHKSLIRRLEALREQGIKTYVLTARHDFNESATNYAGEEFSPVEGTRREELPELYRDFGFADALEFDGESLSYVAQLAPGVRMLVLNSDGSPDGHDKGTFSERLTGWIKLQMSSAKRDNEFLFAINHYPVIPGSPIFEFVEDARMKNWRQVATLLADGGVPLVFTGHMHNQSIKKFVSAQGNPLYDVCTSALVGSPANYRKITIENEHLVHVESVEVPSFEREHPEMSNKEFFDSHFDRMITVILEAMRDDYPYFMRRIGASPKKALRIPVTLGGRFLNSVTLGGIGRMLFFRTDKAVKHVLLKDFAVTVVRNIFAGDQPYVKGTPEYDVLEKFLRRTGFVLRSAQKKIKMSDGTRPDLRKMLLDTVGNSTGISDYNGDLAF